MRIAIDLQGIQSPGSRSRGIGRYSKEIIQAMISCYPDNQYILVANSLLNNISEDFLAEIKSEIQKKLKTAFNRTNNK